MKAKRIMLNKSLGKSGPKPKFILLVAVAAITSVAVYNWVLSPQTAYLSAAQQYEQIAKDAGQRIKILEKLYFIGASALRLIYI